MWFIEGLDLWVPDINKMESVAPVLDSLQRVATRNDVCVIGSVGSPKQKGKDRYFGRDAFFGSAALARKADTMVSIEWTDPEDTNSARSYSIMPRNGPSERLYKEWRDHGLHLVDKPEPKSDVEESKAFRLMRLNVFAKYQAGDQVVYSRWGPSGRSTMAGLRGYPGLDFVLHGGASTGHPRWWNRSPIDQNFWQLAGQKGSATAKKKRV